MLPLKGNSACKFWQEKFHFSAVPDDNWETSPVQSRGWDGINCFFQGQVDFCIEFFWKLCFSAGLVQCYVPVQR